MVELRTTFTLAEPPRRVPASLHMRLLLGGAGQLGWLFFGFGLAFVWIFGTQADLSFYRFWSELETVDGRVTQITKTNFSEGGGDERPGKPVCAYDFAFTGRDGRPYRGRSYSTAALDERGDRDVVVEFPKDDPSVSRIRGMRRAPLGPAVLFTLLFPAIGLVLVLWRLRSGWRAAELLRSGRLALATVTSKEQTNTEVNKKRVYRVTLSYETEDGAPRTLTTRTTEPDKLGDDEQERVLYDPADTARAAAFDTLPGSPRTDDLGQFRPAGARGLACLLIPAATLVGHGLYVYNRLTGWRPF